MKSRALSVTHRGRPPCLPAAAALSLAMLVVAPSWAQIDVWIDPGHGGTDPGNTGFGGTLEKNVNLQVAGHLFSRLGAIGYSSDLTHRGDSYPTLPLRASIANGDAPNDGNVQEECQIFISIHMNAPKEGSANAEPFGTETYYSPRKVVLRQKDAFRADSNLAEIVHPRLMTGAAAAFLGCNRDRHIQTARHVVTRMCQRPSILIEVCFITNQCQRNNIIQNGDQTLIAQGIAAGVSFAISPGGPIPSDVTPPHREGVLAAAVPHLIDGPPSCWLRSVESSQSYSEGFEGGTFPPPGWTVTTLGLPVPHRWHRTTDGLHVHGGVGAALVGGQSPGALDEWLISPTIFLEPSDRGLLFIWSGNRAFAQEVSGECLVRPVGTSQWTRVWSLLDEPAGGEFEYRERVADLTPWIGDSVNVAFRSVGSNGADFSVDDIAIGDFEATAAPANDLCTNAVALPPGSFSFNASTCYAANDADPSDPSGGSCSVEPLNAGDVFYRVTALAGETLEINLVGSSFPVAYLLSSCDTSSAICLGSSSTIQTATADTAYMRYVFLSSGTYYLVVDALSGDCGDFLLAGTLRGSATAVDDPSGVQSGLRLSALPNPASGGVRFVGRAPEGRPGTGTLRVFDSGGRLLFSRDVVVSGGPFEITWDRLSQHGTRVPAGFYLARFEFSSESMATPVVLVE
jgi:N-acetylmuramoyl-L-alanine amidase